MNIINVTTTVEFLAEDRINISFNNIRVEDVPDLFYSLSTEDGFNSWCAGLEAAATRARG